MDVDEGGDEPERNTVSHTDSPGINDVSAFALKARVIYPINQRYRIFLQIVKALYSRDDQLLQQQEKALSSAKHLERLCRSSRSSSVTQEATHTLITCLLLMEKQLKVVHSNIIQEAELTIQLTSQSLEELTADGQLEFDCMEKLIGELQSVTNNQLQRCTEQVRDHTLQLVTDHCGKMDIKWRKMVKAQSQERRAIQSHDNQDAQQVATKLFSDCSEHLRSLWREHVGNVLTTSATLSEEHSCDVLTSMELSWTNQMQQKENHTHQQLQMLREQLGQSRQIWTEQEALAMAALDHLGNQNRKVTVALITRQKALKDSASVIEGQQRLLLSDLQHHLTAQLYYNTMLSQMTTTQLSHADTQSLQQEFLCDLETAAELLQSHAQFLIGQALAHNVRLRPLASVSSEETAADDGQKEKLIKALGDGVCVSRDSLSTLILNYCSHLQTAVTATQLRPPQQRSREHPSPSVMASGVTGSVSVALHPLVILNISDHWIRLRSQEGRVIQVIGALIGKQEGRNIEVMNSFELLFHTVENRIHIDKEYYYTKEEQFKQVFKDMEFLGWYTTGGLPDQSDIHIHKQVCEIIESPLFLKLNPMTKHTDLPVSVYESVIDIINGEATMLFAELPYTLATEEAERIGVDHVARMTSTGTGENSTVAEHLIAQHSAIKMLHSRVKLILEYVKAVEAGEVPFPEILREAKSPQTGHEILREANALCHRLPVLSTVKFKTDFYDQCNDVGLMAYLGTITKTCNSMNQFINKFNVLYDRQGIGRRMRGLFF
ncbi:COP9 signalosome complex subunit 6 [Bagarius yarrelli]|uniref:COP9 signalosome complex subunit 6 n=1 Tax=Bagarius yarrelli TaxID=175774 RepID=A0A556TVM0_BAGYA|nr:COP9 signalosome complex subunit 6 [Bagarius yarrelli]